MSVIKTAVIGFGLSGKVFHAPFINCSDKFELSAVMQRSGNSAGEAYPGIRIARTLTDVLEDEEIELVVIGTPSSLHYVMAKEVLVAGKHVIVEKPFTPTEAEGAELIELAEKQDCRLFVFHNRRWDGDFMTVREVITSGSLGDLVSYEAHYDRYAPDLHKKKWKEAADPSISVLHDLGTHIIDQAVCLFGAPLSVTAHLRKEREGSRIYDAFDLFLEYDNFHATLKSSLLVKEEGPRYIVHGRRGSFVKYGIDPQEDELKAGGRPIDTGWGEEAEENWGVLNSQLNGLNCRGTVETLPGNYMEFYENVFSVIRKNGSMAIRPREALLTVRIIEAAERSHMERKTITL